jgi:hypothetical protein
VRRFWGPVRCACKTARPARRPERPPRSLRSRGCRLAGRQPAARPRGSLAGSCEMLTPTGRRPYTADRRWWCADGCRRGPRAPHWSRPCRSPRRRRAGTRPTVRPLSTRLAAAMLGGARAPARNVSASKQALRRPRSGSSVTRRAALRRVCGARTLSRSPTLLGLAARVPVGQSPLQLGIPALSPTQLRGPVGLHATCGALLHVPFLFVERAPPTYRRNAPTAGRSRRMNTLLAYLRRMSVL